MDLLRWMENVSNRNAKFSLAQIEERRRGVCFEYAILFWYLMEAAGIDTYLISDHSNPEYGHAYNMVVINGTGYIVDTTWDSANEYKGGRITKFDGMKNTLYFMPDIAQSYVNRRW
jgi:transglutaminase/protease-like cytokinesis protein 3